MAILIERPCAGRLLSFCWPPGSHPGKGRRWQTLEPMGTSFMSIATKHSPGIVVTDFAGPEKARAPADFCAKCRHRAACAPGIFRASPGLYRLPGRILDRHQGTGTANSYLEVVMANGEWRGDFLQPLQAPLWADRAGSAVPYAHFSTSNRVARFCRARRPCL